MTTLNLRKSISRSPLRRSPRLKQLMKNKSLSQSVLICLFAILAFVVCNSPAGADTTSTYWTGTSSDWFSSANWNNGVPTSSLDAYINNSGKAGINNPNAIAQSLTLGLNAGDSGTVLVSGPYGSLSIPQNCPNNIPGAIYVGYRDTGTLNITGGGTVSCGEGYIAAVADQLITSNGTVTVSGTGSTWTISSSCGVAWLFIGGHFEDNNPVPGGTALLTVNDGGTVIVSNPAVTAPVRVFASGTLTGNGTIVTTGSVQPETTVAGTLAPSWTLSIYGNLFLFGGATTLCNVTPQNSGSVDVSVSGTATLDGRLSVIMTGTFTPGTQFTLLHADSGLDPNHNRFASVSITYPPVPTYTPVITYDAHNVYLYLRPN